MATSVRLFFREKNLQPSILPSLHYYRTQAKKNISQETLKTADNSGQKKFLGVCGRAEKEKCFILGTQALQKGEGRQLFFRYMTMTQFSY